MLGCVLQRIMTAKTTELSRRISNSITVELSIHSRMVRGRQIVTMIWHYWNARRVGNQFAEINQFMALRITGDNDFPAYLDEASRMLSESDANISIEQLYSQVLGQIKHAPALAYIVNDFEMDMEEVSIEKLMRLFTKIGQTQYTRQAEKNNKEQARIDVLNQKKVQAGAAGDAVAKKANKKKPREPNVSQAAPAPKKPVQEPAPPRGRDRERQPKSEGTALGGGQTWKERRWKRRERPTELHSDCERSEG